MPENIVKMTKGDQKATAPISAFKKVWEPKGWKLVDKKDKDAVKDSTLAQSVDQKNKEDK